MMDERPSPEEMCREITVELIDIATWLADGKQTPEDFQHTVATFEAKKIHRFGFKLSSSISSNRLVHFTLKFADNEALCSSMDVNPATGEMTTQHTCV